uniref:granulocyte-macrophage colony-stimulating factor receptor subunit alpha-like n=1 Tax=Scatophagus argus TaxID=75038 RepID=UPI001ED83FE2|nr:granulocyte-macrophage colony-stimulating factor receptor subunit alpha-like [Scatophagus argus]
MKLLPVHSVLCSGLLFLWTSQSETEANHPDVCQDENYSDDFATISLVEDHHVEEDAVYDNYRCLLYPTNILNCSWSFHKLHEDTQLFVYISVCNATLTFRRLNHPAVERVGSMPLVLQELEGTNIVIQFNVSLHDKWTVYGHKYDIEMLEVLPPPHIISASVKDKDLVVTWALPKSRVRPNPQCFEYQLDMGDQERPRRLIGQLFYTELNVDPEFTYRVRLRTRMEDRCQENGQWSDWSHTVEVEPSSDPGKSYKHSTYVIISISLGIPMILLAVLLLVRYQRVTKVLFPPIPRPPPKYIYFLEKNDAFSFHPPPSAEPVEDIVEVEDTEENLGKTL